LCEPEGGERVPRFAAAFVERALRLPDAAKVEANGRVAQRIESLGERLRNFVVERAALERMRMGDKGDAARRSLGDVLSDLQ
jgi:hypothetical protein